VTPADLRARRRALGLDQGQLARHLGVWRGTVNRWEAGRQPIPHHLGVLLEHLDDLPARPAPPPPGPPRGEDRTIVELVRRSDGWALVQDGRVVESFGPGAAGHAAARDGLRRLEDATSVERAL
jgi:transcriptional regulator with XRE-family HTH domain